MPASGAALSCARWRNETIFANATSGCVGLDVDPGLCDTVLAYMCSADCSVGEPPVRDGGCGLRESPSGAEFEVARPGRSSSFRKVTRSGSSASRDENW